MALGFCCTLKAHKKKMLRHRSHQKLCVYTDRSPLRLEKEAQASSAPGFRRAGNCPADAAVSLPLPRLSQLLFLHLWQREKVLQILFPGYCMTLHTHVLATHGGDIASARTFQRLPQRAKQWHRDSQRAQAVLVADSPRTTARKGMCCYCIEADSGKARPTDTTRVHFSDPINFLTSDKTANSLLREVVQDTEVG